MRIPFALALALVLASSHAALAHPVQSPVDEAINPAFDITHAEASTTGRLVTFAMEVAGQAGSAKPLPAGQLHGAGVAAYVWPTSLNPSSVGFEADSGILALAITAHPDFDDTPLFDENGDGDPANDGANWHSHWVVLAEDSLCGAGLKVRDVSPGQDVLPATAPNLPIALDSPGMSPVLDGSTARITVPVAGADGLAFDAVTAELTVNTDEDIPLLCVTGVHDIASGDLSLPGIIMGASD
ncbi:hypothetical protein [Oceanicaulis sp.]|uniref:hypothetical protein n=1 Tax=Oceanicaulis sp. TaxID=1924941 RepID=UPI003F703945